MKISFSLDLKSILLRELTLFFKRFYLFIFRERGGEGEKHQCEKHRSALQPGTWPAAPARALTGNQSGDLLVHGLALSPLSHASQGENSSL